MNNNEQILKLLLLMAFADKVYMEEEKEFIKSVSAQLNVSEKNLDRDDDSRQDGPWKRNFCITGHS